MNLLASGPFVKSFGPFPSPNNSVGVVSTAPTLTEAQSGLATSDGCIAASVVTNVGNGTLYWAVVTDGGSCTDAELKAGTGGDIVEGQSGALSVTSDGEEVLPDITGLDSETEYQIKFLQTDAGGSDSAQASADLTTTA